DPFANLLFELDAFHSSKEARPLHVFNVFPRINVDEISSTARKAGVSATIEKVGEDVYKIEIVSARERQHAYGYLVNHGKYWNILVKTIESPIVAGNIAERWLKRLYPAICRSYVKSKDILSIMDSLSKVENSKLELMSFILRAHDSPETTKKWPRGKPYSRDEIERIIGREKQLLEGINFSFKIEQTYFSVRIQADGHFVFYEGGQYCFSNFQRLVLSRFDELALENHTFFSNRERKVINDKIKISKIVLDPIKKMAKNDFETLSSHLSSTYSTMVLHSGNPWLLLDVIDRGDGSVFGIHGYSSEIQIVPFNRASPESLMKLVHSIYELFPLAEIRETS
ncbi:MAG: hypothetical protein LAO05_06615, partial [Acidobacteriia bacterium]|nr:hypothetical protein [Terriglobia bacterium]